MDLCEFFSRFNNVAVAFSGGVDSSFLLDFAKQCNASFKAYFVSSDFVPSSEFDDARTVAKQLDVQLEIIHADLLSDENIVSNPENRCYFCKRLMFDLIAKKARTDGFSVIIDGTNASDDISDRPGYAALTELGVISPLRICGVTKSDVRRLSREIGLFTADKPTFSCLATRICRGERITAELLSKTELAETFLKALGFCNFRVRTSLGSAFIEITEAQTELFAKYREIITRELLGYYNGVSLSNTRRTNG